MSCCGRKSSAPRSAPAPSSPSPSVPPPVAGSVRRSGAFFRYVGRTALTVTGPATGRTYRFDRPGVVVGVDVRDAAHVAGIPTLQRVLGPGG